MLSGDADFDVEARVGSLQFEDNGPEFYGFGSGAESEINAITV